ncbi:MAG: aldolase/citrate lyase family protein [Eubacteriaceae bacterium]|nr:aldolase/citrate lyase family protein [Eubacteriaceae bacterium]
MLSVEASGQYSITGTVWKEDNKPHAAGIISKCFSFVISEIEDEIMQLNSIGRFDEAEAKESFLLLLYDPAFTAAFSKYYKQDKLPIAECLEYACEKTSHDYRISERRIFDSLVSLVEAAFSNEEFIDLNEALEYILFVRTLTLQTLSRIDPDAIVAVVCEHGSASSHAAMFLKTLGIPAFFNTDEGLFDRLVDGEIVSLKFKDSNMLADGEIFYFDKERSVGAPENTATKDGQQVEVLATINQTQQSRSVGIYTWDGIGLVRTEFLFARTRNEPSVHHQALVYSSIAKWSGSTRLIFRLFDFGEDKSVSWINDNNRLFVYERQARALLSIEGIEELSILIPKTASHKQVEAVREIITRTASFTVKVHIGAMIETISGVADAERIIEESDFINIGTNDLSAESIGVRRDEAAATVFMEPKFLLNMSKVLELSLAAGKPVTVCGEMMSSRQGCYMLIGLGTRAMSVELRRIPETRSFISEVNAKEAAEAMDDLLRCETQEQVHLKLLSLVF